MRGPRWGVVAAGTLCVVADHGDAIGGALVASVAVFVGVGLTALGSDWSMAIAIAAFVLAAVSLVGAVIAFGVRGSGRDKTPRPVDTRAELSTRLKTIADEVATLVDTRDAREPQDPRGPLDWSVEPAQYRQELEQHRKETLAQYLRDIRTGAVNAFDEAEQLEAARQNDRAWVNNPPNAADLPIVAGLLRDAAASLSSTK